MSSEEVAVSTLLQDIPNQFPKAWLRGGQVGTDDGIFHVKSPTLGKEDG